MDLDFKSICNCNLSIVEHSYLVLSICSVLVVDLIMSLRIKKLHFLLKFSCCFFTITVFVLCE